jgi:hypothetical protein
MRCFGDQKPAPPLGNLVSHLKRDHNGVPVPADVRPSEVREIGTASAKIMEDFLLEGKLNSAINTTQKNFLKIFTAWIIEDDLAFTTGETDGMNYWSPFIRSFELILRPQGFTDFSSFLRVVTSSRVIPPSAIP